MKVNSTTRNTYYDSNVLVNYNITYPALHYHVHVMFTQCSSGYYMSGVYMLCYLLLLFIFCFGR